MTPDDKFPSSPLILPCYAHPIFPNKTFISLWFAHVFQWRFPMAARCLLLRGRHGLRFSTLLPASVHRRWLLEIFKGWVRSSSRRPKTGEIPWDIFDIHGMQLKYVNKSISWLVSLNMECLLNEPFCSKHDEASIVGGHPDRHPVHRWLWLWRKIPENRCFPNDRSWNVDPEWYSNDSTQYP
jgi:hypothetical protein